MTGGVWRANVRKEWDQNRTLLLDFAAATGLAVTVFGAHGPLWFTYAGLVFAGALGARIGGSETLSDTWEFVLSRPIDRRQWASMRFALGLSAVLLLLALVFAASACDLHAHFASWLADPVVGIEHEAIAWRAYVNGLAVVVLAYAAAHWTALAQVRASRVPLHSLAVPILALAAGVWLRIALLWIEGIPVGDLSLLGNAVGAPNLTVSFLLGVMALVFYALCQRTCVRREIDHGAAAAGTEPTSATRMIAWLVIMLAAVLALLVPLTV